ncbi:hypothetical protein [Mesorhizobium retamae]|uniref:Uncharacterized protein n=1 Tax=Mesorhizobium retamae TaxID=2912854 RepID=A0ABS9QI26_9HYPH|nr:hypothetical protein [Mesorhizobium sp. IRAMC:0171]MCG7507042.1 hypothetical protein [Mesorhizobium sp. IRAMC:0171]
MIALTTIWLAMCLALCGYAWYGVRRLWALPALAVIAAMAIYAPTGTPRYTAPPAGQYTVLGARIDVPDGNGSGAIYVLLDNGNGEPTYYLLPYTTGQANDLQEALDTAGEGGTVKATMNGEGGGMSYDGEAPVTDDSNKAEERPQIEIGG